MSDAVLKGSCMCGKITYELRGPPRVVYYCHCGKCRRQSGSAFATNVMSAGTLLDDLPILPSVRAFVAHKPNWDEIRDGLPQHPEYFA